MMPDQERSDQSASLRAAALLVTEGALVELSAADAREVVSYMRPQRVGAGQIVIRAGETRRNDFMALVLHGEVTVENAPAASHEGMVVSVLGPGSLIGEMGLVDGGPRSATCTANSDLVLAVLTREAVLHMMDARPAVAARLMLAIAKRIADHLRDTNRKLMTLARVSKALQQELDAVHTVNKRLLDQVPATPVAKARG